jgi:hypothetical protein
VGTGTAGEQGPPGPQGPIGLTGPAGAPGRDAVVSCRQVGKKKPRVRCTVSFSAGASATAAAVRLHRGPRTFARGRAPVRDGRVRIPLPGSLEPGRYAISIQVTDETGAKDDSTRRIRIG